MSEQAPLTREQVQAVADQLAHALERLSRASTKSAHKDGGLDTALGDLYGCAGRAVAALRDLALRAPQQDEVVVPMDVLRPFINAATKMNGYNERLATQVSSDCIGGRTIFALDSLWVKHWRELLSAHTNAAQAAQDNAAGQVVWRTPFEGERISAPVAAQQPSIAIPSTAPSQEGVGQGEVAGAATLSAKDAFENWWSSEDHGQVGDREWVYKGNYILHSRIDY